MARYKEGDVVLSTSAPIVGYGKDNPHLSNALCIVRKVHHDLGAQVIYDCTTIATGEEVYLLHKEIQHFEGADNNDD